MAMDLLGGDLDQTIRRSEDYGLSTLESLGCRFLGSTSDTQA